ncbi:MAG TPA: DUF5008 domain-containing protein [Chitinophagaceae bacterium]|nr:DUF5008 domain-containing protein [Chitinophagaceae bacterium]
MRLKRTGTCIFLMLCMGITLFSCKDDNMIGDSPYANGPEPLVHFKDKKPSPAEGDPGTSVTFAVTGLNTSSDYTFYINQTEAEILSTSDSTVTVKIPEKASSGAASVTLDGQAYYGPVFTVEGKVSIATSFNAFKGANHEISQIIENPAAGYYIIVGSFTDYSGLVAASASSDDEKTYINHIAAISKTCDFREGSFQAGKGSNGSLNTIARSTVDGDLFVGGTFGTYNVRSGINNITRLNLDASLDSMTVDLINLDPEQTPNAGTDTVPSFNGGVAGGLFTNVVKLFYDKPTDEVYVIGNFTKYINTYYKRSTKDGKIVYQTEMHQIIKLKRDGSLDSSFNYDPAKEKSAEGGNGYILDAVRTADDKMVIVGNFTTFNGKSVNRICRIDDKTGKIDMTFNTGSGADDAIGQISYNETTGKFLLTGAFHNFNGVPANGVVMLNADGSVDTNFKFGETTRGRANFAGQLDNGLILVSGRFLKYNDVVRSGFMILNPDGTLADGYNNTGAFVGQINQIVEEKTTLGKPGVIIVGNFSLFNNREVNNIVKIAMQP